MGRKARMEGNIKISEILARPLLRFLAAVFRHVFASTAYSHTNEKSPGRFSSDRAASYLRLLIFLRCHSEPRTWARNLSSCESVAAGLRSKLRQNAVCVCRIVEFLRPGAFRERR